MQCWLLRFTLGLHLVKLLFWKRKLIALIHTGGGAGFGQFRSPRITGKNVLLCSAAVRKQDYTPPNEGVLTRGHIEASPRIKEDKSEL